MKISIGTDIIEISRVKDAIENIGNKFIEEIYTDKEIEYCESKKNAKYQHYAARFAGKEAIYKAISNILENKFAISWKDVQILNDINGRPYIDILNEKIKNQITQIDISISHCKEYAVSTVIINY